MFERHKGGDSAVLVCLDFGEPDYRDGADEFVQLVESAGVQPLAMVEGKRARPDPAYFAGSGKAQEIAETVRALEAPMVIFNHQLSPAQERNLERIMQCRVIDRTTLILDIFAQRARTAEGKLQVELAQLAHIQTRLIRGWTHLERQKGGIGLRGPGETQLETDRRLIGIRVKRLKAQLATVQKQRATQRRARTRRGEFTVSIVGYTNAGKSTLFNALTKAKLYAADQLFATLDTTSRKLFLDTEHSVVLSDTVGFIRSLPHTLVAAFRATLEETIEADLLLHVVDINHPLRDAQVEAVNSVLQEIGAEQIPQLMVWNKIDLKGGEPAVLLDEYGKIRAVRLSAMSGNGLDLLRSALVDLMSQPTKDN
ncbi:ribosome rescue GTPase HflX [Jeongeupia sp. USM3]|uniref:ribosome rescue GTPase HflX n=1 Tax=Jeongeupia sp. USM3 TaxID=1906741 RepID=UPI00089DD85D|nr:ribosome rescue GTPase HflX [Jeongeupia sp. USM3]AOX99573.1 GTPase HflX [Jeongeupia sp. USM3]